MKSAYISLKGRDISVILVLPMFMGVTTNIGQSTRLHPSIKFLLVGAIGFITSLSELKLVFLGF